MIAQTLQAGDTLAWTESVGDYLASAGWTLKYQLNGASANITINSTASGDDHAFAVTAATSAAWTAGDYKFQRYVSKAGEEYTLDIGTVTVLPNIRTASAGATLSHVKKVLVALEAMIEGRATKAQASVEIAGRALEYLSPSELRKEREAYKLLYQQELAAERIAQGLGSGRKIVTRSATVV